MRFELSVFGLRLLSVTVGRPTEDDSSGIFLDLVPVHLDVVDDENEDGGDETSLPFGFASTSR